MESFTRCRKGLICPQALAGSSANAATTAVVSLRMGPSPSSYQAVAQTLP